jgi:hypothetical protein
MKKRFDLVTVHYAAITIAPKNLTNPNNLDLCDEINKKVDDILFVYTEAAPTNYKKPTMRCVEVDDEFCCDLLTEVGLRGSNRECVRAAAVAIVNWVDNHKDLYIIES